MADATDVTTQTHWLAIDVAKQWHAVLIETAAGARHQFKMANTALAEKLQRASPHWMRHSHASQALACGAGLTTVRDNLRHASIATTSMCLRRDDILRAREINQAFGRRWHRAPAGLSVQYFPFSEASLVLSKYNSHRKRDAVFSLRCRPTGKPL